jgi:hypothetical protein
VANIANMSKNGGAPESEQSTDKDSTSASGQKDQTPAGVPVEKTKPIKYDAITLRSKSGTEEFFKLFTDHHAAQIALNADSTKSDSASFILQELLTEFHSTVDQSDRIAHLDSLVIELEKQNTELIANLEIALSNTPDTDLLLPATADELKLIKRICEMRYADTYTKAKYRLEKVESPGEMLIHLIRNSDNLYNANGNFYTGYNK